MKKASTELFDLIQSLTTSEKAYFKRYAGMHKGAENSYFKLFEIIAEQSEYCEEKIKVRLKNEKLVGYFSRAKKYLFDKILESMRLYHEDKNIQTQLWRKYEDVHFLYSRNQFKSASRLLKKLKKEAEQAECWMVYAEAYRLEIKLIGRDKKMGEKVRGWSRELRTALDKAYNSYHFSLVTKVMSNYWNIQTLDPVRTQYKALYKEYLMDSVEVLQPSTIEAKLHYYKSFGLYYKAFKEYALSYQSMLKAVELLELNPVILKKHSLLYFYTLDTLFSINCDEFKKEEAGEVLGKIEKYFLQKDILVFTKDFLKLNILPRYYFNKLVYCFKFALHKEGLKVVKESILDSKRYPSLSSDVNAMLLANMYFLFFLIHEQWEDALVWVNYLLVNSKKHHKTARLNGQLWQLLIHTELGDYQLLDSLLRNTVRSWQQDDVFFPYLQGLVKKIRKQIHQEYADFWADVKGLALESAEKNKYRGVDTVYAFAESRIQGRSFEAVRREMIEAYYQKYQSNLPVYMSA